MQVVSSLATARYGRLLKSTDVIDVSPDLFILRGIPGHIRSDNGPEFNPKAMQGWIAAADAKTAYVRDHVLSRLAQLFPPA